MFTLIKQLLGFIEHNNQILTSLVFTSVSTVNIFVLAICQLNK